jgi:glycerol-3-phosphate dehydrogenase (NAD(P)+)
MKIAILGAGAWGTALAIQSCQRHQVTLWARNPDHVVSMHHSHINARYLPGCQLPAVLSLSSEPLDAWLDQFDLIALATPTAALRSQLALVSQYIARQIPVIWLCKGFEAGWLPHEVQRQAAPGLMGGALSGPSFALEVALGMPTALVAASEHAAVRATMIEAFHGSHLRVYGNPDITGVEVGGAVKNVLAIATGLCDGLQLGLNARAALITRGLAEITRLGLALGAQPETFMGLSGLGDLVLTATGDLSRNRQVGLALAKGMNLKQAVDSLGHVAEGVYSARTVLQRACQLGVDMPIAEAVLKLLDGLLTPGQAVASLMGREPRGEYQTGV